METTTIVKNCSCCAAQVEIHDVPLDGYHAWKQGELIQIALPELSAEDRELLISGTCDVCWNMLFPEDDEE